MDDISTSTNISTESSILLESSIILITDNSNGLCNYYTYSPILLESSFIPNSDGLTSTITFNNSIIPTEDSNDCGYSLPDYSDENDNFNDSVNGDNNISSTCDISSNVTVEKIIN